MTEPSPTDLRRYLAGIDYPATRADLLASAARQGAGEDVLHRLRNIEPGPYDDVVEVSAAYTFLGETGTDYGHVTVYDQ